MEKIEISKEKINELIDKICGMENILDEIKGSLINMKVEIERNNNQNSKKLINYDPDEYLDSDYCMICISRDCRNCPHEM